MTPPVPDVDALLGELDRLRQSWISGRIGWNESDLVDQDPEMTIFGPFGGPAAHADNLRQGQAASMFRGGTGSTEIVSVIAEGDLVFVLAVEENEVLFEGEAEPKPWVLRTTQVFRRKNGRWLRLHRHADPLVVRRSLADTRQLLDGLST